KRPVGPERESASSQIGESGALDALAGPAHLTTLGAPEPDQNPEHRRLPRSRPAHERRNRSGHRVHVGGPQDHPVLDRKVDRVGGEQRFDHASATTALSMKWIGTRGRRTTVHGRQVAEKNVFVVAADEYPEDEQLDGAAGNFSERTERERGRAAPRGRVRVPGFHQQPDQGELKEIGAKQLALKPAGKRDHMRLYFGPLPPSRGVQRGPSTSVALQSTQFGGFTRSWPSTCSYTPAGHTWL